jgi:hypothetical protein
VTDSRAVCEQRPLCKYFFDLAITNEVKHQTTTHSPETLKKTPSSHLFEKEKKNIFSRFIVSFHELQQIII